jgi:hypothetical protein
MKTNNTRQTSPKKEPAKPPKIKRQRNYKPVTGETPEQTKARKEAERIEKRNARVKAQSEIEKQIIPEIIKENEIIFNRIPKRLKHYKPEEKENILNNIIDEVSQGKSLFKSCAANKITTQTFYNWCDENKKYFDLYARAYANRADSLFDKSIDIAVNMPDVNRARLVIDTIKWVAGKINPQKYSDKQTINIIGNVTQNITSMTPEDRDEKIRELMQKAGKYIDVTPG